MIFHQIASTQVNNTFGYRKELYVTVRIQREELYTSDTNESSVNSEIFARVLFSRNFAYAEFRENKILEKWRNYSLLY